MIGMQTYVLQFIDPDENHRCALCMKDEKDNNRKKIILSPSKKHME